MISKPWQSSHSETPITQTSISWFDIPRTIWYFLDREKSQFVIFNAILFLVLFYGLVPPLVLGATIDFFTKYHFGDSLMLAYGYAIFLGASYALISIIRLYSKNILSKIGIVARARAKVMGFERLMEHSLLWHSQENSGNKVQRILTGSQAIYDWTQLINQQIFPIAVSFISVLIFFLIKSPLFSIFLLVYAAIFFVIEKIFSLKIKTLNDTLNRYRERSSGAYIEGTGNVLAVKALGAGDSIHSKIVVNEEAAKQTDFLISAAATKKWIWFQVLNGLTYTAFVLLVIHQVATGLITLGLILVYITYFNNLREAAGDTSGLTTKMLQMRSDMTRMMPIFLDTISVKTGLDVFPKEWSELSIQGGTFAYPSGQVALHNLDFHIKHGERLGVAGTSGSGKSTLAKIVLGLYQLEHGDFTIGTRNFYRIAHQEILKNIAIVLQETELFNLSLRENITVMREENNELLERAIEISQLKDVVERLPQGIDTLVGERGYFLSGGERQRLGIARAIYKNCSIIIFDEATSALDIETEKRIMDQLFSVLNRDKTLLIIAHRLSTIKDTDRVVMFEEGSIVEEGQFNELIKHPDSKLGHFYSLQEIGGKV